MNSRMLGERVITGKYKNLFHRYGKDSALVQLESFVITKPLIIILAYGGCSYIQKLNVLCSQSKSLSSRGMEGLWSLKAGGRWNEGGSYQTRAAGDVRSMTEGPLCWQQEELGFHMYFLIWVVVCTFSICISLCGLQYFVWFPYVYRYVGCSLLYCFHMYLSMWTSVFCTVSIYISICRLQFFIQLSQLHYYSALKLRPI